MNSAAGEGYLATPAVATIAQWAQMANWETIERRFTMQLGRIATFTGLSSAAGFRAYSAPIACFAYEDQRGMLWAKRNVSYESVSKCQQSYLIKPKIWIQLYTFGLNYIILTSLLLLRIAEMNQKGAAN